MDSEPSPFLLHAYSGRENGLMIVGDKAALEQLGRQLQAGAPLDEKVAPGWPPAVARPRVVGPYGDVPDFAVSFHLRNSSLETLLPRRRRTWRSPLFILVAVCAVTGAVTILQAAAKLILRGL